ncbi:MAG: RNA polymerase factor sigma-54 [Bacteroidales bacterium]|jgi:RNA polymerase sigma-54 factor|nr:RNA polymerase factor sigma-54 [Bacteroidales bacterium]
MGTQHLSLEQRMGLKMSPKQVQLMRLLQVPSAELQDSIREEIENNPALEDSAENDTLSAAETDDLPETETNEQTQDILDDYFNEDEFDSYRERSVEKEDKYHRPAVERTGFQQQLLQQFWLLPASKLEQTVGEIIIGNLDERGYLARSVGAITNDLAFSQNIFVTPQQVENVLKMVQTLDPAGIGARSIRECLQIQLERDSAHDAETALYINIAKKIVATDARFDEFTSHKYNLLIKRFKISEQDFKNAVSIITRLNPYPGDGSETLASNYSVIPDFIITVFENEIALSLNRDYEPNVRVSPIYSQMLTKHSSDKTTATFIKQKIENARSFIDLVKQRQTVLLNVMQTIIDLQRDYFLTGERSLLKPMILKDIAEKTNLDISTISRITANKYAQTPYGMILLKDLFSQALQDEDGNDVSSIEVKNKLRDIIKMENHLKPLTDDALATALKNAGFPISRRTVTKYREKLNIPTARLRRRV